MIHNFRTMSVEIAERKIVAFTELFGAPETITIVAGMVNSDVEGEINCDDVRQSLIVEMLGAATYGEDIIVRRPFEQTLFSVEMTSACEYMLIARRQDI